MSGYATARTAIATLFNANWSHSEVVFPGSDFTPPDPTGNASDPANWLQIDFEDELAERLTPEWVQYNGAILARYAEEAAGQGNAQILDRVDEITEFVQAAHTTSPIIYWDHPYLEPGGINYGDEHYIAELRCPFRRFQQLSSGGGAAVEGELILAGQGETQVTITQVGHPFAVGDWVGQSGTWVKSIADGIGTLAQGVVTTVVDADTFVLTAAGAVRITAHGWGSTPAALYLDQATAGAVTTTIPTSGLLQQVGTIVDADRIIVNQYLGVNL
jgi:hypothetical protein